MVQRLCEVSRHRDTYERVFTWMQVGIGDTSSPC